MLISEALWLGADDMRLSWEKVPMSSNDELAV